MCGEIIEPLRRAVLEEERKEVREQILGRLEPGGWLLLAPERVFKADAISAEILKRCTGESTVLQIVDDLTKTFNAPRERIHADVVKLLASLADKKLLEL